MTYTCANRHNPPGWKEGGRCQHDSASDPRCDGCAWRRKESTQVPLDGTGGLRRNYNNDIEDDGA